MNPHQWSFAKQCNLKKLKSDDPTVPKQAETKRDGVINAQNYSFAISRKNKDKQNQMNK